MTEILDHNVITEIRTHLKDAEDFLTLSPEERKKQFDEMIADLTEFIKRHQVQLKEMKAFAALPAEEQDRQTRSDIEKAKLQIDIFEKMVSIMRNGAEAH